MRGPSEPAAKVRWQGDRRISAIANSVALDRSRSCYPTGSEWKHDFEVNYSKVE